MQNEARARTIWQKWSIGRGGDKTNKLWRREDAIYILAELDSLYYHFTSRGSIHQFTIAIMKPLKTSVGIIGCVATVGTRVAMTLSSLPTFVKTEPLPSAVFAFLRKDAPIWPCQFHCPVEMLPLVIEVRVNEHHIKLSSLLGQLRQHV
jgi:hypothetical protein